jgi:3-oxocholest-4-en-26-oyl-CoA dehydrogenase alpha subunit
MHLAETADQQALRKELREYFADLLSPASRALLGDPGEGTPAFRRMVSKMGADGWLGLGWPVEFGGKGRPATDQFILFDEVQRAQAPFPFVTINTVGPTLMKYGTEEQKAAFLPGILNGEINFAIGYTEPEAGTDLASLKTRAVLDGDEWVINGNKVYTSGANQADYVWLACRTDVDAPKHKGISIIIVPTSSPGFSWTPIVTVGGNHTTATYYTDVRVPAGNVVSGINEGWRLITTQLNHERVGLAALSANTYRIYEDTVAWCRTTPSGRSIGESMIDVPWVQTDLAKCKAILDVLNLMNWKLVRAVADNTLTPQDSSAVKVFGTERVVEVYKMLSGIVGPTARRRNGATTDIAGDIERASRMAQINTFGGGVNEIQRDIIAMAGLGMARASR